MKKTPEMFDSWNQKMKEIEFGLQTNVFQVKAGEFWWYWEGMNIGSEISKDGNFKRPCLVLWVYRGRCCVVPLTTKGFGKGDDGKVSFESSKKYCLKQSWFLINHLKIIDLKRLSHKHIQKTVNKKLIQTLFGFFYTYTKRLSSEEKSIQTRSP